MKTIFKILLVITTLCSCEPQPKTEHKKEVEYKVVKDKKEKMETHYQHVFSAWKGELVLQPNIETAYYIIYTDGSYDNVDMGKYSITEIGDTIIQ